MEKSRTEADGKLLLTEKEQHCMARVIQFEMLGENAKCLYCGYAFECSMGFQETKEILFLKLLKRLEKSTGIKIFTDEEHVHQDILEGSWIEKCPELMEKFAKMSLKEQIQCLQDPDMLKYGEISSR